MVSNALPLFYCQRSFFWNPSVITASWVRAMFRLPVRKTMRCMRRLWRPWISWASLKRRELVSVINLMCLLRMFEFPVVIQLFWSPLGAPLVTLCLFHTVTAFTLYISSICFHCCLPVKLNVYFFCCRYNEGLLHGHAAWKHWVQEREEPGAGHHARQHRLDTFTCY